jgi:ATP-dependent exoDNAse (exonuclease V) alpha subunit
LRRFSRRAFLSDARQGLRFDYSPRQRSQSILHSEIMTPAAAPAWAGDRERLWNEVERAEDKSTRRNEAKTAREFLLALPHELTHEQRVEITRYFARFLVDRYGMVVDFSIHRPDKDGDQRNFHAHVLTTTRSLGAEGFGGKIRALDSPLTSGAEMARK